MSSNFDTLPLWAKPYAPSSTFSGENFTLRVKIATLADNMVAKTVTDNFTLTFSINKPPIVSRSQSQIEYENPQGAKFRAKSNTVIVNRPIGFFGITVTAKNYKRDEIQYMRNFPSDSFPLGVVSLDKADRSVFSQKLQYGKQAVIAAPVLQMVTVASYLGATQSLDDLTDMTLDTVNGRLYYPDIVADIGLLTIYQSCVMTYTTDVTSVR